jgi:hypothetical protein
MCDSGDAAAYFPVMPYVKRGACQKMQILGISITDNVLNA